MKIYKSGNSFNIQKAGLHFTAPENLGVSFNTTDSVSIGQEKNNSLNLRKAAQKLSGKLPTKIVEFSERINSPACFDLSPDGNTVLVGSYNGGVYAFDSKSGNLKWRNRDINTNTRIISAKGTMICWDSQRVISLNPETGQQNWNFKLPLRDGSNGNIFHYPVITPNGTVVFGEWDRQKFIHNRLYALDSVDGSNKWTYEVGGDMAFPPVDSTGGVIIVGRRNNNNTTVFGINSRNGKKIWEASIEVPGYFRAIRDNSGNIFFTAANMLYILDGKGVKRSTSYKLFKRESLGLSKIQYSDYILVRQGMGKYRIVDSLGKDIELGISEVNDENLAGSYVADKDIFLLTSSSINGGFVAGLDGKTGRLLWKKKVTVNSLIKANSEGIIYTADKNGGIFKLNPVTGLEDKILDFNVKKHGLITDIYFAEGDSKHIYVKTDRIGVFALALRETQPPSENNELPTEVKKIKQGEEYVTIGGVRLKKRKFKQAGTNEHNN